MAVLTPRPRAPSQGPSALSGDVLSRAFGLAPDASGTALQATGTGLEIAEEPAAQETPRTSGMKALQRRTHMKESVAFLLGRAPESLQPPLELKALELATPRGLREMRSSTKTSHDMLAIEGADPMDDRFTRKRDRVTEYLEILNQQSHIVRKK